MATVLGGTSVRWNGTELQTTSRAVVMIEQYGRLSKLMNTVPIARANLSKTLNRTNQIRTIPCMIQLKATNPASLKTQVDTLQTLLTGVGNLDIDLGQDGTYRRFIAEPSELDIKNVPNAINAVNVNFNWVCVDPFGRDTSTTTVTLSDTTITGASETSTFTLGGTADQLPTITLTINSVSASSFNSITVTNPATGMYLVISRLFAASDVIVFDLFNKSIKVNGTEVDYLGPLAAMVWANGAGSVTISDDFSSRNMTLGMTNLNLYK